MGTGVLALCYPTPSAAPRAEDPNAKATDMTPRLAHAAQRPLAMAALWGLLGLAVVLPPCGAAGEVALARRGEAAVTIVLADSATAPEQTAARELAHYLGKVTGGTFRIVREAGAPKQGACVYVGPTRFARSKGLDGVRLGPEEWVQRTVGPHLVLVGGRPRGTLYSVYRFLEDRVGVHWWNAYSETVPRKPSLELAALNRRGKPVLRYRDIYMLYGNDGGRFAARNRLNREGDAREGHAAGARHHDVAGLDCVHGFFPARAAFSTRFRLSRKQSSQVSVFG